MPKAAADSQIQFIPQHEQSSSNASLCKHALKMSFKEPSPEVTGELQIPAPQTPASRRVLPTGVSDAAFAGHRCARQGTGWGYSRLHLKGNKEKVFFRHHPNLHEKVSCKSGTARGPRIRAATWAAGGQVVPHSLPPSLTSAGEEKRGRFESERQKNNHLH